MAPVSGPIYVDASVLAKLYVPERGTRRLLRLLRSRTDLIVSDLAITEVTSAIARRKRSRDLSDGEAAMVHRSLLDHSEERYLLPARITSLVHREAERMLLSLEQISLRAADALHLALALSESARSIATFDQRMREAAVALGLEVIPRALSSD